MRGTAFSRQLKLLAMLESRQGIALDEAASELGARRRTVYRDLEVLEQSGLPLISEKDGRHARWKIMDGHRHRLQLSLTWSELLSLVLAKEQLAALAGTLFYDGAQSALEKIRATLPRALADQFARLASLASAGLGGREYRHRGQLLMKLVEAISERKTIRARYRGTQSKAPAVRTLDPLHLHVPHDSIYLLAFCHRTRQVKTYLLDRLDEVTISDSRFNPPENFDPKRFVEPSFAMWGAGGRPRKVRFIVSPSLGVFFMEKKIHRSQVAQRRSDGSVEVTLEVAIGPPLVRYLCSHGSDVSGIEPSELAQQVKARHRQAIDAISSDQRAQTP